MAPPDGPGGGSAKPPGTKRSGVELLKQGSLRLRGALADELAAGGTQVTEDGYNLLKFHGSYEQHDRDTATARKQRGEEKDYSFMVRVRMPGGAETGAQYLAMDRLADRYANGTLRITTRQGFQFHGVVKGDLKPAIAEINAALLTTQSACGDVVRNITTTPAPRCDAMHDRLRADARLLSEALLPTSRAYQQIFLDEPGGAEEDEPDTLYGETYLPRKFKVGIAVPSDNTIDVLTNDLGFVAVFEGDRLLGYNVAVGGGLGMTHNRKNTYPRLASFVGSVGPDELVAAARAVIGMQRDQGDRGDRRRARLKYVVDDRGLPWVIETIGRYLGHSLASLLPASPLHVPELLGWHEQGDGRWWVGVPVPSGRIQNEPGGAALKTALRIVVERYGLDPILTPQQDVLLSNVSPQDRGGIEETLRAHGVALNETLTPVARWALACPALPTCGLALTEAERVRADFVAQVERALERYGLLQERISLRITGCPNGCARTYAGDIGIVGRVPGSYAIYVGGDFEGTRLSFRLHERVPEGEVGARLDPLFRAFARDRVDGEGFGDFCHRLGSEALLDMHVPA